MAKIKITINDLYNYICEHNTISDVVDMIDLKEDGYKRLRRALNWNNIPVIPPQEKKFKVGMNRKLYLEVREYLTHLWKSGIHLKNTKIIL